MVPDAFDQDDARVGITFPGVSRGVRGGGERETGDGISQDKEGTQMVDAWGRERRQSERFRLGDRARVTQVTDSGRVGATHDCVIVDVSSRGMKFRVGVRLVVEEMVTVETDSSERGLTGLVRWIREDEPGEFSVAMESYAGPTESDFLMLVRRARSLGGDSGARQASG